MILTFNPTLLHWATGFFSLDGLRKYKIWAYLDKYLNIAILFRISPPFQKWYRIFNLTLFFWATALKKKKLFGRFLENIFPRFLKVLFYILKHIRLKVEPAFRLLVSPSVRPSEFAILFSTLLTVPGFRDCFLISADYFPWCFSEVSS